MYGENQEYRSASVTNTLERGQRSNILKVSKINITNFHPETHKRLEEYLAEL